MNYTYDEDEILSEIDDSEIEWEEELVDVYTEGGEDFAFDDLVEDFNVFSNYMFKRMGFDSPTYVQSKMIDFLFKPTGDGRDKMIQGMRGIGKSMLSQLYVLWRLLRNNDEHILVRSGSAKRARNYTTFLLNLIKTTPILQHLSPRSSQRKSSELFDVNGAKPSDSPSVLSAGIGANVTGLRATIEILDDVEVASNSGTPDTRETLKEQINENYNLLVESDDISGEVIVLGTFQSSESVYVPMIQSGAYSVFIVPAQYPELNDWYKDKLAPFVVDKIKENPDIIGTAIDTRFTMQVLEQRRLRIGKSSYELHYMLNPMLQDDLKYPLKLKDLIIYDIDPLDNPIRFIYSSEEKLRGLKHRGFPNDYFVTPAWTSEERAEFDLTILAIDPSGRGSDETGYVVISFMGGKQFYRDFGGLKGGYDDETFTTLVGLAKKYGINAAVVESNFGDGAYTKMLEAKFEANDILCDIEEVRAVGQKEKRIIDTLEPLMNQHRIIVDRAAMERDFDKKGKYSLSYQLTHICDEKNALQHDDIIDVCELGSKFLIDYMARNESFALQRHSDDRAKEIERLVNEGFFPHQRSNNTRSSFINKF